MLLNWPKGTFWLLSKKKRKESYFHACTLLLNEAYVLNNLKLTKA